MAKKNGTHVVRDNVPSLAGALKLLATQRVMVGIPADKANRKNDDAGPINNAQLMAIHEYGAPEANIPARPVVEPTVRENRDAIRKGLKAAGDFALKGDKEGVDRQLHAVGIFVQNKMRAKITDGPFAPLSERTLAGRRAKGRTGTKPLIDTGQLRRALTYVIRSVRDAAKTIRGK